MKLANVIQMFKTKDIDLVQFTQEPFSVDQQNALDAMCEMMSDMADELRDEYGLENQAMMLGILARALRHDEHDVYHSTAVMMNVLGKIINAKLGEDDEKNI